MTNSSLILYSTEGCHLCEEAFVMVKNLNVDVQVIDIAHDDKLFDSYGVTIPVLKINSKELNWPFNEAEIKDWLV